ncbi:tripartite tricarboxylate transporter substrate binding protein [Roseomonas sp. CAU 1739]|uniref:Bug family tripartite tricarboxylate transporter substrate binding protein n=1 Tax=Roseomonas sp. CAU 1739 TaxID=3140364 RepID=UPI00325A6948
MMRSGRRRLVLATLGGVLARPALVTAQGTWPNRPVRILISFPPGGSSDVVARIIAPHLTERFGRPFVVDNRPGAGGMLAANTLKREPADGYAFLLSNNAPFTIAPTMFPRITYDALADFSHVAYLGATFGGVLAHPSLGARAVPELIAKAHAAPGQLNYGSSGIGSIGHITGATFARMAGVDMVHIPYRGAAALRTELTNGTVQMSFEGVVSALPAVQAGQLLALATASEQRLSLTPDVPTFRETGQDIVIKNWHGMSAPAGLPASIATPLHAALAEICARPDVTEAFLRIGNFVEPMTQAGFTTFVADQIALWRPMIIEADAVEKS